ncbi:hypothetical protein [Acidiferrobacter sp.]|uniref:hypothetical protein n=1 Tax=Acidiferrobacter sp. TaxID=1872107 RepID=UPI002610EAAE|nr:hypothetical protein [Acidiferrobacter sp.]
MRYAWLGLIMLAGAGLSGCASAGGGCHVPAYVVPPPLPPLSIPSGLSAPPNQSRYAIHSSALATSATRRAPGSGHEAHPPGGMLAPAPAQLPPAN